MNKLKTKCNNLFYRIILNTNRIEETSPQELNKRLQKFYLSPRKNDDRGRSVAKIVIVGNSKWVKIIIFVLNYLTVLVYTKTIIHLSVGG